MGWHISTIYRELKRNIDERNYYYASKAHAFAVERRKDNGQHAVRISEQVWCYIEYLLEHQWSPEQISHFTERIYLDIYRNKKQGGELYLNLRHVRCKRRNRRLSRYKHRSRMVNTISIERRPKIVENRRRIGDFEVDTVISGCRNRR